LRAQFCYPWCSFLQLHPDKQVFPPARHSMSKEQSKTVPRANVAFHGKQFDQTVTTSDHGFYQTDLPFGSYTMLSEGLGFRPYRRPLFRVTLHETINFDFTLAVRSTCDIVVVRNDGGTPTPADWEAATKELCFREDSFPIPSTDGLPFQLLIRYGSHQAFSDQHLCTGKKALHEDRIFVAYNLFSLQADEVVYVASDSTVRATGNVVAEEESGLIDSAEYMTFKIENGHAMRVR
jgi:hypothetical protein